MPTLSIIGGGAAGMCAAIRARQIQKEKFPNSNLRITIYERNPRLGIKIRISGGGKCNITHEGDMMAVLREGFQLSNEKNFLKPSFFHLSNTQVLNWLHERHVETYTRDNGRVFPVSGRAEDVLEVFETLLQENEIEVLTFSRVLDLKPKEQGFSLIVEIKAFVKEVFSDSVIISTGGVSYSKTGTTGDGIKFAKKMGHKIENPLAALAPIYFHEKPKKDWVGVSLRDVTLFARNSSNEIPKIRGDVLITHIGISGPACLSISRHVAENITANHTEKNSNPFPIEMCVDFLPEKNEQDLQLSLIEYGQRNSTQLVKTLIGTLIPNALVEDFFLQSENQLDQKWNSLQKEKRKSIASILKSFKLGRVLEVPIEKGEVSAGGVSLKDVNPKTMQSRLIQNLYFAGEVLDVAGEVGGFNLQAAYSTGWVSGEHAALQMLQSKG
ncbi:MAG: aminoacetone oxidase family FAD-binding enzyme [Chloroherpetonaceae bacterium]|nr:aminoacetone oxidase family FAD-binding enzyme [Chloroherpetonaceae bacterium]